MDKLVITVAVIGGSTTPEQSPYPPMIPKEIAQSAVEVRSRSICLPYSRSGPLDSRAFYEI